MQSVALRICFNSFRLKFKVMSQVVVPVPNPKFQVGGLQTTAPSIVSHRVVKIPATFASTYTGQRIAPDGLPASSTTMKYNIASNEDFLDLSKFIMCFDVTWIGPESTNSVGDESLIYGMPLNLVYDQSTQAFIAQLTFGSPQGMKFEEIQNYNLFANMISQHTENSIHKERNLLDYSDFFKEQDKPNDLRKCFDGKLTFRETSRIRIGERTRVFLRFHHSSWLNNQTVIPLFLLRNGIEAQILLESPHKMVTFGHLSGSSKDMTIPSQLPIDGIPNWFIGAGVTTVNSSNVATAVAAADCITAGAPLIKNLLGRKGNDGTTQLVPSVNTLWLNAGHSQTLLKAISARLATRVLAGNVYAVPISIYELGTIVWSGIILVDPNSHGTPDGIAHLTYAVGNSSAPVLGDYSTVLANFQDATWTAAAAVPVIPGAAYGNAPALVLGGVSVVTATIAAQTVSAFQAFRDQEATYIPQIDEQDRLVYYQPNMTALTNLVTTGTSVAQSRLAYGFPMYSLNDLEGIPYVPNITAKADMLNAALTINRREGMLVIHAADIVKMQLLGARTANVQQQLWFPVNPAQNGVASALALWSVKPSLRKISYKIEKAEMLMRLLKPTSEEFAKWQSMFQQPSGIPIKMNSILYRKQTMTWSSGVTQVNLPVSVRSMKQIFFVIQDAACDLEPQNCINALALPNLSTYQSRRLTRYEVIVGGQQYPIYPLELRDTNNTYTKYGEDHIPELESAFGIAGNGSFNPSFSKAGYKQVRNLLAGGLLGQSYSSVYNLFNTANRAQRCCYVDTASKVFAMSICKDEVNSFATGIDSSQSGAVSMNLYFSNPDGDVVSSIFQTGARPYDIHIFVICDAVVTLQEAANLRRQ